MTDDYFARVKNGQGGRALSSLYSERKDTKVIHELKEQ